MTTGVHMFLSYELLKQPNMVRVIYIFRKIKGTGKWVNERNNQGEKRLNLHEQLALEYRTEVLS
jgi:hypothetical protein